MTDVMDLAVAEEVEETALDFPGRMSEAAVLDLADRLVGHLQSSFFWYRRARDLPGGELSPGEVESYAALSPRRISWEGLAFMAHADPEACSRKWQQVHEVAAQDVREGQLAHRGVRKNLDKPIELAQFDALRLALIDDWKPRGMVEQSLLDQYALAYYQQMRWTAVATERMDGSSAKDTRDQAAMADPKNQRYHRYGTWVAPRLEDVAALEQAVAMAERWNKTGLRVLRALRDFRRYSPSVIVNNGGQVNLANQQVNQQVSP